MEITLESIISLVGLLLGGTGIGGFFFWKQKKRKELAEARLAEAEAKLKESLDAKQRKLLLQLTDCQNSYRQEAALSGFLSGWRAALGIRTELDALPRFSLIDEDEARMREED